MQNPLAAKPKSKSKLKASTRSKSEPEPEPEQALEPSSSSAEPRRQRAKASGAPSQPPVIDIGAYASKQAAAKAKAAELREAVELGQRRTGKHGPPENAAVTVQRQAAAEGARLVWLAKKKSQAAAEKQQRQLRLGRELDELDQAAASLDAAWRGPSRRSKSTEPQLRHSGGGGGGERERRSATRE